MHINNIMAGILGVIISVTMLWMLWVPVTSIIEEMPAELQVMANIGWISMVIFACVLVPMSLVAGDDKGSV